MNVYLKKIKKKIALFLVAISVIILVPTDYFNVKAASNNIIITTSDGFIFDKSTGTITNLKGTNPNVVIPSEIEGYSVTSIGDNALNNYYNENITSIFIPSSVIAIGKTSFPSRRSLMKIEVDNKSDYFSSEDGVLFNKEKDKIYCYPSKRQGTSYVIPDSVTSIGDNSFGNNSLINIVIPKDVYYIGENAFSSSLEISEIKLPDNINYIGTGAFGSCRKLTSIDIPDSATYIGNSAFSYCSELKKVNLSKNIKVVESAIFSYCGKLQEINIPEGVTSINRNAFVGCSSLESIIIPNSVNSIGMCAFESCSNLVNIKIPDKVTKIEQSAFSGCKGLVEVKLPDGLEYIGESSFSGCKDLTSINIPNKVKRIDSYAFSGCIKLTDIVLPNSVVDLGSSVFSGCSELKNVILSDGITQIKGNFFMSCSNLENIAIPNKVITIDTGAFFGCTSLKNITLPDSVTTIRTNAFALCSNLEKIIIPKSVKTIEPRSFNKSEKITIYGYEGSYAQKYAFENNISFNSLDGFNRSYAIRILDKETKLPVSNANIRSDSGIATTDDSGIAMIPYIKSTSLLLNITREGYKSYNGVEFLSPNTINTIEIESLSNNVVGLNFVNPPESTDTIYGPEIKLFNKKSNLFKVETKMGGSWFNNAKFEVDTENKTIKALFGMKKGLNIEPDSKDPYWRKAYGDLKDLVKSYGGDPNSTTLKNKFKNCRGMLSEVGVDAGFNASGYVAGYAEFSYSSGKSVLTDGGLIFQANASVSETYPFTALPVAYVKFGISGSLSGDLKLDLVELKNVTINANFKFSVTPSISLGAGIGKVANIEAGINGALKCTLDVPKPISKAITAKLTAEVYVKANVLSLYEDSFSLEFGEFQLYPRNPRNNIINFDRNTISKENFKLMSRDYLNGSSMLQKNMYNTSDNKNIKQNIYPYCNPIMKSLSNGKRVLVWIDDLGADKRTSVNRTCLMYSIYSEGTWSQPTAVYDDNTGDFSPSLYIDGNKVYLAWLNANKVFNDNVTYDEVSSSCDINFTELDGDKFKSPVNINIDGNNNFENYPKISANNGEVSIAWMENSDNDPFMQSGKNTIFRKKYSNKNWQPIERLKDNLNIIYDIDLDYVNGESVVAYSYDKDGDYNTGDDMELCTITSIENKNNICDKGNIEGLQFIDGNLYWNSDGKIKMLSNDSSTTVIGDIGHSGDFKVLDGETSKVFLWLNNDGFKKEIVGSSYDKKSDELSNPIKVTSLDKGIRTFSPIMKENGEIAVAYNISDIEKITGNNNSPYGKTDLIVNEDLRNFDLEVTDFLQYDENSISNNNDIDLTTDVRNNSFENIEKLKVSLFNENGEKIKEDLVLCSIKPGGSSSVKVSYRLPKEINKHKVKMLVNAIDKEEKDTENNYSIAELGYSDLAFEDYSLIEDDIGYSIKWKIKNKGFDTANNIKVSLFKDGPYGTVIDTKAIAKLDINEEQEFTFRVPNEYNTFTNELNNNLFCLEAVSNSRESDLSNNIVDIFSNPIRVSNISIDKTELIINNNNKKTLVASVIPANVINSKVIWLSSNNDVAVVDEKGVVKGLSVGETIISATSVDGNYTTKCKVKIFKEYDFNYDGIINKLDLSMISNSYNALVGDANYFEEMDINKDGIIDIYDISKVSSAIEE
ncbi:leucine-rich repeat protein [Clostridium paraputrificum]|uniref:leucine-rich repeat protein n=1 Tax=Clostridium paraputrificum TaxID=29363 RepID=UPI003D357DC0